MGYTQLLYLSCNWPENEQLLWFHRNIDSLPNYLGNWHQPMSNTILPRWIASVLQFYFGLTWCSILAQSPRWRGGSQSPYCPHYASEQCLWEPSDGSWKQSTLGKRCWTDDHVPQLFGNTQSNSTPRESSFLKGPQQTKVNFKFTANTWLTHTSKYRCLQMYWWFVPKIHSNKQMKMWRKSRKNSCHVCTCLMKEVW